MRTGSYGAALGGDGGLAGLEVELHPEVDRVLLGGADLRQLGKMSVDDVGLHDGHHIPGATQSELVDQPPGASTLVVVVVVQRRRAQDSSRFMMMSGVMRSTVSRRFWILASSWLSIAPLKRSLAVRISRRTDSRNCTSLSTRGPSRGSRVKLGCSSSSMPFIRLTFMMMSGVMRSTVSRRFWILASSWLSIAPLKRSLAVRISRRTDSPEVLAGPRGKQNESCTSLSTRGPSRGSRVKLGCSSSSMPFIRLTTSVVPSVILSKEMVLKTARTSAQASFRHLRDKFSSECGSDASSTTIARFWPRGDRGALPWAPQSSGAGESCHTLPPETHTGSFLFTSCRLIRRRSVVCAAEVTSWLRAVPVQTRPCLWLPAPDFPPSSSSSSSACLASTSAVSENSCSSTYSRLLKPNLSTSFSRSS
ncbi:hypothetical protein CRUP_015048 [Coryphaenoides rupestris]|nr:hypothetical protein CRUP_015048 [Coryphaenoides rupestris]